MSDIEAPLARALSDSNPDSTQLLSPLDRATSVHRAPQLPHSCLGSASGPSSWPFGFPQSWSHACGILLGQGCGHISSSQGCAPLYPRVNLDFCLVLPPPLSCIEGAGGAQSVHSSNFFVISDTVVVTASRRAPSEFRAKLTVKIASRCKVNEISGSTLSALNPCCSKASITALRILTFGGRSFGAPCKCAQCEQ